MASIFRATTKHVAETAGAKTLHPVTDLNSAIHFKALSLVQKKKSFWFWKKPKMIPTQISLADLLMKKLKLPTSAETYTLLENFSEQPVLKVDGKIGAQIMSELNLEVATTDSINLSIVLGDIMKSEVNWQMLNEFLHNNPLNVSHELLNEVSDSSRTTLCVVLESLATKGEGKLTEDVSEKVSTDDSVTVPKSVVKVGVQAKGSLEFTTAHSFQIPADTVLAYSSNEFSIDKNGVATLHASVDQFDNTGKPLFAERPEVTDSVVVIKTELINLMKAENCDKLSHEMRQLLSAEISQEELHSLHLLLSTAQLSAENKSEVKVMSLSTLSKLFSSESTAVKEFLLLMGFILPEDKTDQSAFIEFPGNDEEHLLKPCLGVIDALIDISPDGRNLLADITSEHMKVMLDIVDRSIHGHDISKKESDIDNMFMKDPSTEVFLKNVGFIEMLADNNELLCHSGNDDILTDLYTVLYVLSNAS